MFMIHELYTHVPVVDDASLKEEQVLTSPGGGSRRQQPPAKGDFVAIIQAVSASGDVYTPSITYKGEYQDEQVFRNFQSQLDLENRNRGLIDPKDKLHIRLVNTDSGFSNSVIFSQYLLAWEQDTRPTGTQTDCWRLLIVDGSSTHTGYGVTTSALHFLREHKVHILLLPPNMTHELQVYAANI